MRTNVAAQNASNHCPFLSGHFAKTYSARHASGRRPRRSTRRPKALLPPRRTALGEPVHIVQIQVGCHFLFPWAGSRHEGLVYSIATLGRTISVFLGGVDDYGRNGYLFSSYGG